MLNDSFDKGLDLAHVEFGGPAEYRIVVQGLLEPSYSDRLAGMTITTIERGDRTALTILVGHLHDQAELSGVLDTLYNLHLPILEVKEITDLSDKPTTEK
jgi:hypothetical protein